MCNLAFRNWGLILVTISTLLALAGQYLQSLHDFNALEERTAIRVGNLADLTRDLIQNQVLSVRQAFGVLELAMDPGTNANGTDTLPRREQLQEVSELFDKSLAGLESIVIDDLSRNTGSGRNANWLPVSLNIAVVVLPQARQQIPSIPHIRAR